LLIGRAGALELTFALVSLAQMILRQRIMGIETQEALVFGCALQ
jgi:hypothetical protein